MQKAIKKNAISLVELLLCIAILGIFAALVAPSYVSLLEQRRIIALAEAIAADLQWARSEALKRDSEITLTFELLDGKNWRYVITLPNGTLIKSVSNYANPEFEKVRLTENFREHSTSFNNIRGTTEAKNGTITLSLDLDHYIIDIVLSNLGRAYICTQHERFGGYPKCV